MVVCGKKYNLTISRFFCLFLTSIILSLGAVFNNFPFVFSDTGTYITVAVTNVPSPDRSVGYSLFLKAFFFFMVFGMFLSMLAAKLLQFAIDGNSSITTLLLEKLPIVFWMLVVNILLVIILLINPPFFNSYKLVATFLVVVLNIWVFHIETIKTHVMYRLPKKLS